MEDAAQATEHLKGRVCLCLFVCLCLCQCAFAKERQLPFRGGCAHGRGLRRQNGSSHCSVGTVTLAGRLRLQIFDHAHLEGEHIGSLFDGSTEEGCPTDYTHDVLHAQLGDDREADPTNRQYDIISRVTCRAQTRLDSPYVV